MSETRTFGIVAEYGDVDSVMAAARRIRDAGYRRWDVHTPFPVHGMDDAMGVRPTILPWITLGAGLSGLGLSILLQWWTNAHDYAFLISGKPLFSLPANIPVAFESTILFAAVTTFLLVFVLNGLPRFYHPLFRMAKFKKATDDRFFVAIEARDEKFDPGATRKLLESTGAASVEICEEPLDGQVLPGWVKFVGVLGITLAMIPLVVAYRARNAKTDTPRLHLVGDMDFQPKYKTQAASPLFADGRAMRPQVDGTIARGELRENQHLELGTVDGNFADGFPVAVTRELMERGRNRFDIYCSVCHGYGGQGDGPVALRAKELGEGAFVAPTDLTDDYVKKQPAGQIYATIRNGIRTMPSYAAQIPVADRWAIVLYLRALQRHSDASIADVPLEKREEIK
ncbi:MAG: DUF3341 domain-containing protein [Planctomycetes bacterium]|nr:DUF3341 domain-containing protein [Planctomycetota bacterium]